jgi:hypothetical protein
MNHNVFVLHVQHNVDRLALSYLEDVWVERGVQRPWCYTIEFVGDVGDRLPPNAWTDKFIPVVVDSWLILLSFVYRFCGVNIYGVSIESA